jgi:hypothetical protein
VLELERERERDEGLLFLSLLSSLAWSVLGNNLYIYILSNPMFQIMLNLFPFIWISILLVGLFSKVFLGEFLFFTLDKFWVRFLEGCWCYDVLEPLLGNAWLNPWYVHH